jgi:hypothetical protein
VTDVNWSNGGGTGRYVTVALDTGETIRYLHLSSIWVEVGWAVDRGQGIAATGASGFGSDWGYDPHVHVTLWRGAIWAEPTIDFQTRIGPVDPPDQPPPPQPIIPNGVNMLCVQNTATGTVYTVGDRFLHHVPGSTEADVAANLFNVGQSWRINPANKRIELPENFFLELLDANGIPRSAAADVLGGKTWHHGTLTTKSAAEPSSLSTPAWVVGIILGVIGVVEVVRLLVDVLAG